jgi:hypothetical protein
MRVRGCRTTECIAAGAQRVWEVRPRLRTVTVHRPLVAPETLRQGDVLTSDHAGFPIDGFALSLDDVFA